MEKKTSLEDFFRYHPNNLLVLSIFLLVTLSLVGSKLYLSNLLALLSALLTYSILIGMNMRNKDKDTFSLSLFKIIFPLFISAFCAWVILNILPTLKGELEMVIWILIWLILMILPGLKYFSKKIK